MWALETITQYSIEEYLGPGNYQTEFFNRLIGPWTPFKTIVGYVGPGHYLPEGWTSFNGKSLVCVHKRVTDRQGDPWRSLKMDTYKRPWHRGVAGQEQGPPLLNYPGKPRHIIIIVKIIIII